MKENEKLKVEEEQDIISSMAKREKCNTYSTFEYEEWMDPILINNVVESMFDFSIALKLVQLDLKNRNISNYELFNLFELRSRWTDIELKLFRKNLNENKENYNEENILAKENSRIINAEKDKRIIMSTIKEAKIDESIFTDAKEVTHDDKKIDKINEITNNKNSEVPIDDGHDKLEKENKEIKKDNKEQGFKLEIREENINYSELD